MPTWSQREGAGLLELPNTHTHTQRPAMVVNWKELFLGLLTQKTGPDL